MTTRWQQVTFTTHGELAPLLEELLVAAGALAVTYQDAGDSPIYEPEDPSVIRWPDTLLTGLFVESDSMPALLETLATELAPTPLPEYRLQVLTDQDWENAWKIGLAPLCFAERLWVCPTACEPPETSAPVLWLDPGLAFGTGTHPTTQLCLHWLAENVQPGWQVLDYGCGTGILAIAALLLGAAHADAVDIHPQAIEASLENAERNAITRELLWVGLPDELVTKQYDCLVANILAQPLCDLANKFAQLLKPGADLVLSGILVAQEEQIRAAYQPFFEVTDATAQDEWLRITAKRR